MWGGSGGGGGGVGGCDNGSRNLRKCVRVFSSRLKGKEEEAPALATIIAVSGPTKLAKIAVPGRLRISTFHRDKTKQYAYFLHVLHL